MIKVLILISVIFCTLPLFADAQQIELYRKNNDSHTIFIERFASKQRLVSYVKPMNKIDVSDKSDNVFYKLIKTKIKWSDASD